MSWNGFGRCLRITTFGESHGAGIGVVVDGVPPALSIDLAWVQRDLDRRRPGQSTVSSTRREADRVEVLAGLFEGRTTGAPIALWVRNTDARPHEYEQLRFVVRPGHADMSYLAKYGVRDWRGGGRSSGRETVARVAAGAIARQLLKRCGVEVLGHAVEVGGVAAQSFDPEQIERNPVRCADAAAAARMVEAIQSAARAGDSVGGIAEIRAIGVPAGWGDPVFGKLDALWASALVGIGAVKAVEIGDGFALARVRGSEANDAIGPEGPMTNHGGGIVGGISNGAPLVARIAVKPTPSIAHEQDTVDVAGHPVRLSVPGRHDPCVVPRVIPVAEAMTALMLADAFLLHRACGVPLPEPAAARAEEGPDR